MKTKRDVLADHLETITACPVCRAGCSRFERFGEHMGFVAEAVFACGGRVKVSSEAEHCFHVAEGCPQALSNALDDIAEEIEDALESAA